MKKFTKELLTGAIALGLLAPVATSSLAPTYHVNARIYHQGSRVNWYKRNYNRITRKYKHNWKFKLGRRDSDSYEVLKLRRRYANNKIYRQGWITGFQHNAINAISYNRIIALYDKGLLYFHHHSRSTIYLHNSGKGKGNGSYYWRR